jgi:uncharacterized membrane protein
MIKCLLSLRVVVQGVVLELRRPRTLPVLFNDMGISLSPYTATVYCVGSVVVDASGGDRAVVVLLKKVAFDVTPAPTGVTFDAVTAPTTLVQEGWSLDQQFELGDDAFKLFDSDPAWLTVNGVQEAIAARGAA